MTLAQLRSGRVKSILEWLRFSPGSPPLDVEETVQLAYMAVLRRKPDTAGFTVYASALREGRDLAWLIGELAASDEFRLIQGGSQVVADALSSPQVEHAHALGYAAPMQIDAACTDAESQALWDHVAKTWSQLGEEEPHWSVLTQAQFRADAIGHAQLTEFYGSGDAEVARLNAWLRRAGLPIHPDAVCAEFGCGVGRVTHSLARQYGRVLAFDVSAPHVRTAQARMREEGIQNVEFVRVTGRGSLSALRDIDVFYSIIALQHSPPPIILDVLEHAFSALRPGGYAFFQLPTFSARYAYSTPAHIERLARGTNFQGSDPDEMEVHFVPQHMVLQLAQRAGLRTVEIQPDTSVGNLDRWISNTFLLARA